MRLQNASQHEQARHHEWHAFRVFRNKCLPGDLEIDETHSDDSPGDCADSISTGVSEMATVLEKVATRFRTQLLRHALVAIRLAITRRKFVHSFRSSRCIIEIDKSEGTRGA